MKKLDALPVLLLALVLPLSAWGFNPLESKNSDVSKGNELLAGGQLGDALARYDEAARGLPGVGAVHLNRGLALSRMGEEKTDEAMQAFSLALDGDVPVVRARAHANLGNMFFKKEDFAAAIDHYKKSLMLHPGVRDVAWNLELASQRKKQQEDEQKKEQEQQDQENQDQSEDGEQNQDPSGDQQQEQNQEPGEDDPKEEKSEPKPGEEDQQSQEQDQPETPEQQPSPKTQQEMEQILDSLEKGDDNLAKQKARHRGALAPRKVQKDW